jgi:hypothetical protein
MNYIISESRLHEFMSSYLDNYQSSNHDSFIVISRKTEYEDEWTDFMEYDYTDGRLWINREFLKNFSDIFALGSEYAKNFITNWFENKFAVKASFTES